MSGRNAVRTTPGTGAGTTTPGLNLTPTAVKTANYTAVANDFVPVNTTSGAVTVTLPSAPADGVTIGVKIVTLGAGNFVTVARGGSDVFNVAGGSTSLTLKLLRESVVMQYKASTAIWYVVAGDKFQVTPSTDMPAVTGSPSATTYLRGDNTWSTPSGSSVASQPPHVCPPGFQNDAKGINGANECWYGRVRGTGSISNIGVRVNASSGNICVAVCGATAGRNAPSTRRATSGSVACPAVGFAQVSLGTTLTVDESDYFAFAADNTTATAYCFSGSIVIAETISGFSTGFAMYQTSAFPVPASPVPTHQSRGILYCLIGT